MNNILLPKIKEKKALLAKDGFEIIGIFGSFAKGKETKNSDIDILYDIKPLFIKKFGGFEAFAKINEIRDELKQELGHDIDLATIDSHSSTFKKFALQDVIYV